MFLAIRLSERIKDELCRCAEVLRQNAVYGNFSRRENLHLTLVFIGESARVDVIRGVLDAVKAYPFTLTVKGLGRFRRSDGDIWWAGVEKSSGLLELQRSLQESLLNAGFRLEAREYTPHLTLGRKVRLLDSFDPEAFAASIASVTMEVGRISLMKSERVGGELTYTPVYERNL